jgi:hypothetical protein
MATSLLGFTSAQEGSLGEFAQVEAARWTVRRSTQKRLGHATLDGHEAIAGNLGRGRPVGRGDDADPHLGRTV